MAAAQPGDTIIVCPGLYLENVVVSKTLKLKGATKALTQKECFEPTPPDPTQDTIVDGVGSSFTLLADDIELTGFVVQGAPSGIVASGTFSGYWIHQNVAQDNPTRGIALNSNGVNRSLVEDNCVRANAASQFFGIAVAGSNSSIDHNTLFRNRQGITMSLGTDIGVTQNTSLEETFFLSLFNSSDVHAAHNKSANTGGAAITLAGGNTRVRIEHNEIREANTGIDTQPAVASNVDCDIAYNNIQEMTVSGIRARQNGLNNSRILFNHSTDNGQDGVRIEAVGNAGNRIENNILLQNAEHDCHDDTVGPGTAGTANFWDQNKAETDNRGGQLCPPRGKKK